MKPGHDQDTGAPLVPLEEARSRSLAAIRRLPPVALPLRQAHGCVAADDVAAPIDLPPFASSSMDGFAVRAADVAGAAPGRPAALRLAGEVRMGSGPEVAVGTGEAVAVPTGGVVPEGADAIVPVEQTETEAGRVLVRAPMPRGRHVRTAGEDARAGDVLVPGGKRLLAADLGLLASAGVASVAVHPRARVGILSTGDELVEPGRPLGPGRIPDANAFTLHGCVVEAGAIPVPLGHVPDDPDALARALAAATGEVDVLLSSGGVSVGEHDPVKAAFTGRGEVAFLEVAMQPGKPQAFGVVGGRPYFGLPGNPVSVFVSFETFVRPALMTMMGRSWARPEITATLETDITGPKEKVQFARVRVRRSNGAWLAASTGGRQSNLVATLSRADGLAVIPVGVETARAGQAVTVLLIRDDG
ncbi:MAG: molybdopterin molybdotransferase MoeA [Actinomycetota bacterium]